MPVIILTPLGNPDIKVTFPMEGVPHCSYVKGMLDAAPDGDAEIEVPHADEIILSFITRFLQAHKDDAPVEEGWEKLKPRELTEADKKELLPIVGVALVNLLKAFNFLGCQLGLNATATYLGQVLVTKNEQEVQSYFGIFRTFSKEEEEQVKAKYPGSPHSLTSAVPFQ
jgi:hypothetical protein